MKYGSVFPASRYASWFKLYFICKIYDNYTSNTEYDYNTTTIQMGFRRKSNDLFKSVSQEFKLLIYLTAKETHIFQTYCNLSKWLNIVLLFE